MSSVCGAKHPSIPEATCISLLEPGKHPKHYWRPPAFGAQPVYWPNESFTPPFRGPIRSKVRKDLSQMAKQVRAGKADPPSSHTAAALIEPSVDSCKARVLAYLQGHEGEWVGGNELETPETGGDQGLKRLRELRADGHQIELRPTPGSRGTWQYRLNP